MSYLDERESSLGYLAAMTSRLLVNRINKGLAEAGIALTTEQWTVLIRLWDRNGLTQHDIATSLILEKSSVSRLLDGLEKHGWVRRERDVNDARQKRIMLTAKAMAVQDESVCIAKAVLREAQTDLSPEEQKTLRSLLLRVIGTIR